VKKREDLLQQICFNN